jgi:hypothetical protein
MPGDRLMGARERLGELFGVRTHDDATRLAEVLPA